MDLRERGREGQILADMVEVLRELTLDVEEVAENQEELEEYVEEIDSDLMSLEEDVYLGDDDDEDTDLFDSADDDDVSYIELECPVCELESSYNEALFNEDGIQLTCPHCGNVVFDSDEDYLVVDDEGDWVTDDDEEELFD
nr:CD1247 N-terminal domain-containing protein [Sulfobacillus harzensis]